MATTIGIESTLTLTDLTELILATEDSTERKLLIKRQRELAAQMQVLIDREFDETLPEYIKAINALKKANAAAEEAKEKLDKIAGYITKVGRAIGVIGEFIDIILPT